MSKLFITENNYNNLHEKLCSLEKQFTIGKNLDDDIIVEKVDDVIEAFNHLLLININMDITTNKENKTKISVKKYDNLHEKLCFLEKLFVVGRKLEDDILIDTVDEVIYAFNMLLL